jgi:alkylated DNA nucleotide flippase Atl1
VELEDLKKEIIRKCSGLPLAARVLGEIMKEKMEEAPVPNCHTVTVHPQLSTDNNSNV